MSATTITRKLPKLPTKSSPKTSITSALIKQIEANPHIQGLEIPIKTLVAILDASIHAYYNTDKPLLSDNTFDILFQCLQERDSSNPLLKKVGAPVNPEDKVALPYYLGSLDKVKPNEKSLTKWLKTHNKDILISDKIDGLSSLLVISLATNNNLKMHLYKHGDGNEGQDISHLLDHISIGEIDKKLIIKAITEKSNTKGHIALRGEIIIRNDIYDSKYNKMYPKARSLIAGIVNSKKPDASIVRDMEIVFYELIYPSGLIFTEQFAMIARLGFHVANHKLYKHLDESQLPAILLEYKEASPYEIDGIVLDDSSKAWERTTKDNPDYAVAFKMQLEDQIATTKVLNVEYNISKHGTLAPRIEYEPVVIKGDTHKYTTGFNLKYIVDNRINKGTQLQIIKSGDVIPYIYKILEHSPTPMMPPENMKWHWNETHVDAILDNPEANEDVRLQKLVAFFKTMKIDGIGEGVIAKLVNGGYIELEVILALTPDQIAQVEGFQLKSARNIYNAIHKVLDKSQPLERVMTASGVFQIGLGEKKFKIILDAIPDFLKKYQQGSIQIENITNIQGFSDKTANILIEGMSRFLEWLTLHTMIKIDSNDVMKKDIPKGNRFAGMVIVFTGIRNAEMERMLIEEGGTIGASISGKTTLLVAKDPDENSSKLQKARSLNIQIMGFTNFANKYGFKI
jgi:NAD-dependent DNA ligase